MGVLLNLVPWYYRWLALVVAFGACFGYGFVKGYDTRDDSADKAEAKVEARADTARAVALERKRQTDQITEDLTDAHQADRTRIIRYYERRLRQLPASSGSEPTAERARVNDEPAPQPASCGEGAQRDLVFERACALDASALSWWQEFARRNRFPIQGVTP